MGIFGRNAGSRAEAAGAADVFTAPERECGEALWRLTALPRAEFEATCGAMLGGLWRYARSARGSQIRERDHHEAVRGWSETCGQELLSQRGRHAA